jgi:UDP-N-acetylmuramoyl-tripeptide--D-alanyl-D-alanine ligase
MGELGAHAAACHQEVGAHAREAGIETLYALGDLSAHAVTAFGAGARHFSDIDALIAQLRMTLSPGVAGTTVLVKGSRFMKMERVVDALSAGGATCS